MAKFNHGIGKILRRTVVIDLDGVLVDFRNCTADCPGYDQYPDNHMELNRKECPLMEGAYGAMIELWDSDLRIVIQTARVEAERERTEQWLKKHHIPYDELIMDKPQGFIYIDDLGHHFKNWKETMQAINKSRNHITELIKQRR